MAVASEKKNFIIPLWENFNNMLIQTGRFFEDPSEAKDAPEARKVHLRNAIVTANNGFNDALIELEIEITEAISVFERDLARARAKRIEKERAEAVLPIHPSPTKPQQPQNEGGDTGSMISSPEIISKSELPDSDVVMVDPKPFIQGGASSEVDTDAMAVDQKIAAPEAVATDTMPVDSHSAGLAIELKPSTPGSKAPSPAKQPSPSQQPQKDISAISDTPTTDMNFESMFEDTSGQGSTEAAGGAAMNLNFDLDFSTDTFMNETGATGAGVIIGDIAPLPDSNTVAEQNNEDINTLLPGLENLVGDPSGVVDVSKVDFPMSNGPDKTSAEGQVALNSIEPSAFPVTSSSESAPPAVDATATTAIDSLYNVSNAAPADGVGGSDMMADTTFDDLLGTEWADGGGVGGGEVNSTDFEDWFTDGA